MPTAADGPRPPTGAGGTEAVSAGRLGGKSPRTLPGAAGPEAAKGGLPRTRRRRPSATSVLGFKKGKRPFWHRAKDSESLTGGNQVLVSQDVRGQEATQQPTQDARERGARQGVCAARGALRCSERPAASEHGLGRPREPPGGRRQTRPRTAGRGGRPQGGGWTPWEGWGRPARGHEVLPTSGRGQRVTAADAATPRGTRGAVSPARSRPAVGTPGGETAP